MRAWTVAVPGVAVLLAVSLSVFPTTAALAGTTERVSVSSAGEEGNDDSWGCAGAQDRFVAFLSNASNLVTGDTNDTTDVFVRDLLLYTTERVNLSTLGEQAWGPPMSLWEDYREVAISADGRFVAFASDASNLVPGDLNVTRDVFVRDRLLQTTERVSVSSAEEEGNGESACQEGVPVSADGRYVVFVSEASNLVPGDASGAEDHGDVFVRDRALGVTECVSLNWETGLPAGHCHGMPAMSPDGRFVVFSSWSSDLVESDTNGFEDIFLRDRLSGITERISVRSDEGEANEESYDAWVSGDGRYVVFDSQATNLDLSRADTNGGEDVYLRDRVAGTTEMVSLSSGGEQGDSWSGDPTLSADGRFVAFMSGSTNLVPGDTNGAMDTFVRDLTKGTTVRVSLNSGGQQTGGAGGGISSDGRCAGLISHAADLVEGDTNDCWDVFVRDFGFPDVPKWHWAWRYVEGVRVEGIVGGYWDGYHPNETVTRAQMAVYVSRAVAEGDENVPAGPGEATFSDVGTGHWAFRYVEYAVAQNIVGGYWDGTYRPDLLVDRGQMAVFIARSMVAPAGDTAIPEGPAEGSFPDVPDADPGPAHPAYKWIEYCYAQGVVSGYWDGTYRPDLTVDRAQMAVYVCRAFELPMPAQRHNVTDYSHLQDGDTWTYSGDEGQHTETVVGDVEVGGQSCKVIEDSHGSSNYWLVAEDRVAWAGGSFGHPPTGTIIFAPFFAFPNGVQPGDAGTATAACYLDGGYVGEFCYRIEFVGLEGVTVPAGTFDDCLKWEVEWFYPEAAGGEHEHIFVWFARDIGHVKTDARPLSGTSWLELVSATVGGVDYPR